MGSVNATIPVAITSRLHLPPGLDPELVKELKAAFHHPNPDYHRAKAQGRFTGKLDKHVDTWRVEPDGRLSLPRGGTGRVRRIFGEYGYTAKMVDQRIRLQEREWPALVDIQLRWYQQEAFDLCLQKEQGLIRAPTGSGKTVLLLAVAAATRQPVMVVMRDSNLLDQWMDEAVRKLGLHPDEIGRITGNRKPRLGSRLTLALQQSLKSDSFPLEDVVKHIGAIFVDEAHLAAAATFLKVLDRVPAKFRLGASADETRKDKKEFLLYDTFGDVLYTIPDDVLVEDGVIHPVLLRLIPTDFQADWYRDAAPGQRDFGLLMEKMAEDEAREQLLVDVIKWVVAEGEAPVFVFSQRKEHARQLADVKLFNAEVRSGLMLGGTENKVRFREDKERLMKGTVPVAVGTYHAIGTGLNVPHVRAGVMALPLGSNRQLFNQVRGRIRRIAEGKAGATLYVMWDRYVFPHMAAQLAGWNKGHTEVLQSDGTWAAF